MKRVLKAVALITTLAVFVAAFCACDLLKVTNSPTRPGSEGDGSQGFYVPDENEPQETYVPDEDGSQEPYVPDEDGEQEIMAVKLSAPTNVRVEDDRVKWDNPQDCEGYEVSVNGEVSTTTVKSYRIDFVRGNSYNIKVRVLGDGENTETSDWATFFYDHAVVRLSAPTNLRIEDDIVKWDNPQDCEGYEVSVNGEVKTTTEKSLRYDFVHGNYYDVKARTLGDGENTETSGWATCFHNHLAKDYKQYQTIKEAFESKFAEANPDFSNIEFIFANEDYGGTYAYFYAVDSEGREITPVIYSFKFKVSMEELAENVDMIKDAVVEPLEHYGQTDGFSRWCRNDELTNYILDNMTHAKSVDDLVAAGWYSRDAKFIVGGAYPDSQYIEPYIGELQADGWTFEVLTALHEIGLGVDEHRIRSDIYFRIEKGDESKIINIYIITFVKAKDDNFSVEAVINDALSGKVYFRIETFYDETSQIGLETSAVVSKYGLNSFERTGNA